MTIKDQLAADLNSVFYDTDAFAAEITYTPAGGAPEQIPAILDPTGFEIDAAATRGERMLRIQANDAAGVAAPKAGDALIIEGVNAELATYDRTEDGLEWILTVRVGLP